MRNLQIGSRRIKRATRMIMRNYDARGAIAYGFGKHFARMHEAASECADSDDAFGNQSIGAVEREANEVFLLFVTNVAQLLDGFFGTVDNWRSLTSNCRRHSSNPAIMFVAFAGPRLLTLSKSS